MFDRRLVAFASLLLAARALPAQDTTVARLRHRADSLAIVWRRANVLALIADSLERERAAGGRDTVAVGALRIVINPSPLAVREAALQAWPLIDSLYGTAAQSLVTRPYFIQAVDPDTTVRRRVLRVGIEVPWNLSVQDLTRLLLVNVPIAPPDRAFGDWLGGPVRPRLEAKADAGRVYVRLAAADAGRVYVRLVTAPSQAARRCFLGDLTGCRSALDLDDAEDAFLKLYPTALERRVVLQRSFAEYFNRPATAGSWNRCTRGDDDACIQLLRSIPHHAIPRPLDVEGRRLLVYAALRLGGRGAYVRLLADSNAAISNRLVSAAGVGLDTLLSDWRTGIIAARPAPVTTPPWGAFIALGWIMVLAGCALTSSRWRVT
jgi:hypothetical protein